MNRAFPGLVALHAFLYLMLCTTVSASTGLSAVHGGDLQTALESAMKEHNVIGASAVIFVDGRLQTASAGIANLSTGYKIESDTLMHIGSTAKLFTATLVMQLVDEGLVELDAPVTEYLSNSTITFPVEFEQVTVRMLINHSNGINGDMFPQLNRDQEVIEATVRRLAGQRLLFTPGTQGSYSNGGLVLAGYLVEQVLGMSWYEAVRKKIFIPSGMAHSLVAPEEAILYKTSIGHLIKPGTDEIYPSPVAFTQISYAPAGSTAMTTASDLVNFGRMHLNNGIAVNGTRILSEASAEIMRVPTVRHKGFGADKSWGLGWEITDGGMARHGGGGSGVSALLALHPEHNFAAVVITNTERGRRLIADILNPYIAILAPEDLQRASPPIITGKQDDIEKYAGIYEDVLGRFEVKIENGRLLCSLLVKVQAYDNFSPEPTPLIPLKLIGDDLYGLTLSPGMASLPQGGTLPLHFINPDKNGKMQHIATRNRLYRRTD